MGAGLRGETVSEGSGDPLCFAWHQITNRDSHGRRALDAIALAGAHCPSGRSHRLHDGEFPRVLELAR